MRVLYCYPDTTDDRLLDAIAALPKVAPYVDLPLQHINGDLLKRMNRRGSPEWIIKPHFRLQGAGTDHAHDDDRRLPGETEEAFRELLQFVKEARF